MTLEEKKKLKREYDKEYRARNKERIKERKAEYFKKTYDPIKASEKRKTVEYRERHKLYCRREKYKNEYKIDYDRKYRAKKKYKDFNEAFLLLLDLEKEIRKRATAYEIRIMHGNYNRAQKEKRAYEKLKRSNIKTNTLGNIKPC